MNDLILYSVPLLWIVVLVNLLLTVGVVRKINSLSSSKPTGLPKGEVAPDFKVETLTGAPVTRQTFAGRNLAMLFISPTCSPCRDSLPTYIALQDEAAQANTELVLISIAEREATQRLAEEFNIRLPLLVAPPGSSTIMEDYQASGTPSFCLVDGRGYVVTTGHPGQEAVTLKTALHSLQHNKTRKSVNNVTS